MIRLLKLAVVICLVWSGYWAVSGYGLRTGIESWLELRRADGWLAEYSELSTKGYPTRHVTRLVNPALADPHTGAAWRADYLEFSSPAIWPGRQTLHFAPQNQRLSYLDQTSVINARNLRADLSLAPGLALEVQEMTLTGDQWEISDGSRAQSAGDDIALKLIQQDDPARYALEMGVNGFRPGQELRDLMGSAQDLPDRFETLALLADISFDHPWDRSALEVSRPQPRHIDLKKAQLRWGALDLLAAGQVSVDEAGIPTGSVTLKAENWREMLRMAEAAGAIPSQYMVTTERVLSMFSGIGGNPNALDLTLEFRNGFVTLGPIPIGPAPRLILH